MEYRFGICDEDYHYVVNLMEYVNSHRALGLSFVAFSSVSAIEEYLEKAFLDGALLGEGTQKDLECIERIKNNNSGLVLIPLVGERCDGGDEIYKYQSAQLLVQSILQKMNVNLTPVPIGEKTFYGVYSPLGRCGKTTLAKALGIRHKGGLYIGLETFGARDNLGEEILYHIIFQNIKIHELIEKIHPDSQGLRQVKGILSYMDIRHLKKESIEWLKGQLLMAGDYGRVIFDIGTAVLADLNILSAMDRIYVPILEDEAAMVKLQAFRELLRCKEYREIGQKIQYLNVPVCNYYSDEMKDFISKGEL